MLAGTGAWASGRDQDRTPAPSRQPVPDNGTVSPAARKSYEDFWKRLPKSKADALERELNALEARQRRGESVERDVEKLRREYPQMFEMSSSLQSARWIVSSGGGTQAATCTGPGLDRTQRPAAVSRQDDDLSRVVNGAGRPSR